MMDLVPSTAPPPCLVKPTALGLLWSVQNVSQENILPAPKLVFHAQEIHGAARAPRDVHNAHSVLQASGYLMMATMTEIVAVLKIHANALTVLPQQEQTASTTPNLAALAATPDMNLIQEPQRVIHKLVLDSLQPTLAPQ